MGPVDLFEIGGCEESSGQVCPQLDVLPLAHQQTLDLERGAWRETEEIWDIVIKFFKALALWPDAFYKSICPSVCPSVCPCVSVHLFTFEVPFKQRFAPTS